MEPPPVKPAAFDQLGKVPSELGLPGNPFDLLKPGNELSKRVGEEALEACLNDNFTTLHEILETLSKPDYAHDTPELVRTPERKLQNIALMALVCERLAGAAVTGTIASGLRKLLADRGADAKRLCWLGYVLGRRVATERRMHSIENDFDRIVRSSQMDRKGTRRPDPWNDFISARQMERWATGEKFFTPAGFVEHFGGEEQKVKEPSGTWIFILKFTDPRCADLPPISRTDIMAKVKEQKKNL
jgi:hypothetical protein